MERKDEAKKIEALMKQAMGVYWSEIYSADRGAIIKVTLEYAAQETAAMQKQNAELMEVLRLITGRCDAEILPSDKLITKAYKLLNP